MKKLIYQKLIGVPNRVRPLSRPRRPFSGPLAAILDFAGGSMFLIEGVLGSKNLFSKSGSKWPITQGWTPFQTPSAILGPPGGHFGFCRWFYVSHRRSARIKKLISRNLIRAPNNLGLDTFPEPGRYFGAPCRPFWIQQAVRRCRR